MKHKLLFGIVTLLLLVATMTGALAVTNDAVAYYSFDTDEGATVSDLSGSGDDGTVTGTQNHETDNVLLGTGSYNLTNVGNYISSVINVDVNDVKTINYWFYSPSTISGTGVSLGSSETLGNLMYNALGSASMRISTWASDYTPATTMSTGTWYFITIIYDGSKWSIYKDNVQIGVDTTLTTNPGNYNFVMGARFGGGSESAILIDEVSVYDRVLSSAERAELYNGGAGYNPYYVPPSATINNFSTIDTGSFSFDTPVSIGTTYGTINSITINVTEGETSPFYFSSSFSTYGAGISDVTATCRIAVDGVESVSSDRTITVGEYGNFKLISEPENLTIGSHTIVTECLRDGPAGPSRNFVVNNSQMTQFHLYDELENETINYQSINNPTGYSVDTSDTILASFTFTTSNTTNTTNLNQLVVHGRATYNYDQTGDITTYLKVIETGEVCGHYERGGSAGSSGSVGTTCLFEDLNSSTTYNLSFYGFTSNGTTSGSITNLLMNVYNIETNETSAETIVLNKTVPAATNTTVATINITNPLGGNFNVFVDSGIMVNSNASQDAYFWIENTENSINYYRTLPSTGSNGNINGQFVFSESGTGLHTYNLMAYCPSGCEVSQGDMTAFVTNAESVSTGEFTIEAYNAYNDSEILIFNATIGGSTLSTTNGSISAIGQGTVNVLVEAQNFFSNTTSHDTTINLNASLTKYTEFRGNQYGSSPVSNFTVNTSTESYTTTNGVAYLPITTTKNVTFDGDDYASVTKEVNKVQYYNFTAYETNTYNITFKDSETLTIINHTTISFDLISNVFANNYTTDNGTLLISLLNPVTYTMRYGASGYSDSYYLATLVDDTYNELVLYLINSTSAGNITVQIVDQNGFEVEGAIVRSLRYDITSNTYLQQESYETTTEGEVNFNVEFYGEFYRFIVEIGGEVIKTTDPQIITKSSLLIQVIIGDILAEDYFDDLSITRSLVFNNATNNFRLEYNNPLGIGAEHCLYVYRTYSGTRTLYNSTCSDSQSATILVGVEAVNNTVYEAKAYYDDVYLISKFKEFGGTDVLGKYGLFIQIIVAITLMVLGFTISISGGLLGISISLIVGKLIGLNVLPWEALTIVFVVMFIVGLIADNRKG